MGKIIGAVIVAVIILGALFWWQKKGAEPPLVPSGELSPETSVLPENNAESAIASLKDAMSLGKKMQCTYSSEIDGKTVQSTTVFDGERFKSTTALGNMTVYGLFDGTTQYAWTSKDKNGFKMSRACLDEFQQKAGEITQPTTQNSGASDLRAAFDLAQSVSCKPVSAADFTIPSDIVFTDQCAMMEQTAEMIERLKGQAPSGFKLPEGAPIPQ